MSFVQIIYITIIAAIIIHVCCFLCYRSGRGAIQCSIELIYILIIAYFVFIAYVTLISRIPGERAQVIDTTFLWVSSSVDNNLWNLLNIILFLPLGTLEACVLVKCGYVRKCVMVAVYSFLYSFIIECIQYITKRGYFELEDIEANVLGGILGSLFVNACIWLGQIVKEQNREGKK